MNHETQHSRGSVALALLCGVATGAALGLMFAPKAGSDLRREISDQGHRAADGATEQYRKVSEGVNRMATRGRDVVERGRGALQRTREKAAEMLPKRADAEVQPPVA